MERFASSTLRGHEHSIKGENFKVGDGHGKEPIATINHDLLDRQVGIYGLLDQHEGVEPTIVIADKIFPTFVPNRDVFEHLPKLIKEQREKVDPYFFFTVVGKDRTGQ